MSGVHAKDWLANGPQGAGELVHILRGGHIACLEMDLGHALIVAFDETIEDLGIDPASIKVDMAHDAKIIGNDVAIGGDLHIALVHVSMEIPVAQRMVQEQGQNPFTQRVTVVARGIERVIVANRQPVGPAQCHYPAGRVIPQHWRKLEARVIGGVIREL